MNFARSFDIEKDKMARIPLFFKKEGYRAEKILPNYYSFKRGSWWRALLYARVAFCLTDIGKYPTTAEVITENIGDRLRLYVNYEVRTIGVLVTSDKWTKIEAELENLEMFVKETTPVSNM